MSVWQVPPEKAFPPGINITLITETGAYYLLDGTPVFAGDWIVVDAQSRHKKVDGIAFPLAYAVKVAAPVGDVQL